MLLHWRFVIGLVLTSSCVALARDAVELCLPLKAAQQANTAARRQAPRGVLCCCAPLDWRTFCRDLVHDGLFTLIALFGGAICSLQLVYLLLCAM